MKTNKKIKSIKIIVLFLIVITSNSCSDDFLEVIPNGVLVAQTTNDYDQLLNSNDLIGNNNGKGLMTFRSFEICGLEPHFSQRLPEGDATRNNFTWEPIVFDNEEGLRFLSKYANHIYLFNKVITEVMNSTGGTEAIKKQLQAQAKARRAFIYVELVKIYGKPYNSATALTDLAVPIILEPNVSETSFKRATVQEVYDFIIEDLTSAMSFLPERTSEKFRMSQPAASAILGKVYVYMGKFNEAIPLFDDAIAQLQNNALVGIFDYNVTTLPGGTHGPGFLGPSFVLPVADFESVYSHSGSAPSALLSSTTLISPETSSLYGPTDLRLTKFFNRKPFPALPFIPDYVVPGVYRRMGAIFPNRAVRLHDLHLLRAECNARTNNLSTAIEDLEFFRKHRMPEADALVPTGLSQDELIKFVIDERTREFAVLPELWFDMRRLWNDPLFQDKKPYVHTLYDVDGSVKETFTLDEKRLVLRFSPDIMAQNPDLVNNPE